ncbi:MAG TPA: hypothetical protein QF557_16205 [Myxococcota bacterium]|nr:hypothetical protein [Myxococcota bacterium]MDP7301321.1 hypothetical protein [Myxococcota bacterium]HJO25101.1 hypothetical protein [Myxococcota bacterium]
MSSAASMTPVAPDPGFEDCRCLCGSLLARVVPGGVEVKCRRCKRTVVLPLEGATAPFHRARGVR